MTGPAPLEPAPVVRCATCRTDVPPGAFCGVCGARLAVEPGAKRGRWDSYLVSPGEHLLQFAPVSTLFPHLPSRNRSPFRIGLAGLVLVLVVLAVTGAQAPMIAVAALGVPLVFEAYLREVDVYDDLHPVRMLLAGLVGAVAGCGFAVLVRTVTSPATSLSFTGSALGRHVLRDGVAFPALSGVLLVLPVILLRLRRRTDSESLDGFLYGATGALGFAAASTLTRLAPQLRTGILSHHRPVGSILVEAVLQGITVPVVAASAGGLVGATLWVRHRSGEQTSGLAARVHGGRLLTSPILAVGVVVVLFVGLGLVDLWQPGDGIVLAVHAGTAAVLLLCLRAGLHLVLLHEQHHVRPDGWQVCAHCHHVVPVLPFCSHCGYAHRAATRATRGALLPSTTGDAA